MTLANRIPDTISSNYSGVIYNQNVADQSIVATASASTTVTQEFYLPSDYKRKDYIPYLTGCQIFVNKAISQIASKISIAISSGGVAPTTITLESTSGWPNSGSFIIDNEVFSYTGKSGNSLTGVQVAQNDTTRVSHSAGAMAYYSFATYQLDLITSTGTTNLAKGNCKQSAASTSGDSWFNIQFSSITIDPSWLSSKFKITVVFAADVLNKIYCTSPSLLVAGSVAGTSTLVSHRVLASVADDGIDFLSNRYRSIVTKKDSSTITTNNKNQNYWMSKPNPSEFGVENLYFNFVNKTTIDSLMVDPITPNVYFHVYYSNDSTGPGYDDASWDDLLWTRVEKTFKATKKDSYALPEPISAKYIKIEFSHLQAQNYPVGTFQKPILYKKHPKWVLDYFLAKYDHERSKSFDAIISNENELTYDALSFAFNYYKDDIFSAPNGKETVGLSAYSDQFSTNILTNTSDTDELGWNTLNKIKIAFRPFLQAPSSLSKADNLIGQIVAFRSGTDAITYPTESSFANVAETGDVSVLDREPLLTERNFPVMSFYITCRHAYRESLARFEDNKAYFVGVKEVAFHRNLHRVEYDSGIYVESTNDIENIAVNDFISSSTGWTVQ